MLGLRAGKTRKGSRSGTGRETEGPAPPKGKMIREGNIWQRFISEDNFILAADRAADRKHSKRNVMKFESCRAENLARIRAALEADEWRPARYTEKTIHEPKKRLIKIAPYPDRVVHHAVMNILAPMFEARFIETSYACRKGKGIHAASLKTMDYVRHNAWCLKCDISKFYPTMNHEVLLAMVGRIIKDKKFMHMLEHLVRSVPGDKEVPIGNYTSQWFGNYYLHFLDMFVKHELRVRAYLRYCDDFCLFSNDKAELQRARIAIEKFIGEQLKMRFSKADLFPTTHGVDFVGYRHFKSKILLRKSTSKRQMRALRTIPALYQKGKICFERLQSTAASIRGWLDWAQTHNLKIATKAYELEHFIGEEHDRIKLARAA